MAKAIQCNGAPVLKMRLHAPIDAAWVADIEASANAPITGAATISDGTNLWKGTVLSSGVVAGLCTAIIVGGKGGLRKPASAKSYVGAIARSVVLDILNEAGESLARASQTASELLVVLEHWTRVAALDEQGTAGAQLASVLEHLGATWRVLPDGTIWIGSPSFRRSTPTGLFELDREPARGRVHVAIDGLDLLPDSLVKNDRVDAVEYRVDENGLVATYWLEAA